MRKIQIGLSATNNRNTDQTKMKAFNTYISDLSLNNQHYNKAILE